MTGIKNASFQEMSKLNGIKSTNSAGLGDSSSSNKMVSSENCKMTNEINSDQMMANGNNAGSALSKIGRRIRDSCRNLRGKHPSGGASSNPDDFSTLQAPNESNRSLHYVPMDFSGKSGRLISPKDIQGQRTKDGYTYFRRKIEARNVDHLLTETQANIHKEQPWFHKGVSRDIAQKILASHCVDGLFLVRESSVAGGFVISYYFGGRAYHVPIMPHVDPTSSAVTYSLDEGRTKFFDLLQLVEFYQLNKGTLNSRLTHYIVTNNSPSSISGNRSESPNSCRNASDTSLDVDSSKEPSTKDSSMDTNHNSKSADQHHKAATNTSSTGSNSSSEDEHSVTTAVDANMVSEDEDKEADESMKEDH